MNNPMQFMQMFQQMRGGAMNPQQLMQMLGGNPMFGQAQQMMQGKSPDEMQEMIKNIAKQKGMSESDLAQMAQQFGIKL